MAQFKMMLSPPHPFFLACKLIREKLGFHIDADAFLAWLDRCPPDAGINVLSQTGQQVRDFVCFGSAFAILEAADRAMNASDFQRLMNQVVVALPALVEAMCFGFALRHALKLTTTDANGVVTLILDEPTAT